MKKRTIIAMCMDGIAMMMAAQTPLSLIHI